MGVIDIISILLGIAVGIIAGYFVRKNIYESKIGQANSEADRIIKQAEDDSKRIHKEKLLEAQEEIHKLRTESERENKERRSDLQKFERRVIQKEEILDKIEIAYQLTKLLLENYRKKLCERYKLDEEYIENILGQDQPENNNIYEIMLEIGKKRGCIMSGGRVDEEKTSRLILDEFKNGKLGKITIEHPKLQKK